MADRKDGRKSVPTEKTLKGEDWEGRDLLRQTYERIEFVDVDMTGVANQGSIFSECIFRNVTFNASTHTDAAFTNCTFMVCAFFDTEFIRCKLVGAMFDRCRFNLMKVHGGDWSFSGLPGADLRSVSFADVRLRESDLTGARCDGAVLRNVDLSGAWLRSADFSGCDLRGSDISAVDPLSTRVKDAVIDYAQAVAIATTIGFDVRPD